MKSVQKTLKYLRDVLKTTNAPVYHYKRPNNVKPHFIVWQEDGESTSFHGDNHKGEQQIHGTIDCYTLNEYDELLDDIQEALNSAEIAWSLTAVLYEDETNLIHYEWEFNL